VPRTRCYRNGVLIAEDFPIEDVSEHLEEPDSLIWVDLCAPDTTDLALLADELGLHALAVEDAVNARQRPKLDRYRDHSFLSAYSAQFDPRTAQLTQSEIAAFITPRALVTVRKDDRFDLDAVIARWDSSPDLAKNGVAFLLHGLLDYLVDGYFETVQSLDDEIESLEDQLFIVTAKQEDVQKRSFELRKSLVLLLTIQGNRLNIITKKVTSYAAIIAVPTAVTGFYGQNVPYPGFSHESGFIASSSLIVGLSGLLYFLFRRNDWL